MLFWCDYLWISILNILAEFMKFHVAPSNHFIRRLYTSYILLWPMVQTGSHHQRALAAHHIPIFEFSHNLQPHSTFSSCFYALHAKVIKHCNQGFCFSVKWWLSESESLYSYGWIKAGREDIWGRLRREKGGVKVRKDISAEEKRKYMKRWESRKRREKTE